MTWAEFKQKVEALGVTDDTKIGVIDVYCDADRFEKYTNDDGVVEIDCVYDVDDEDDNWMPL